MTAEVTLGADHIAAQLAATVALADTGAQPSRIGLYTGPAGTGDLLAVVTLAKPCGTVSPTGLTLHPATADGSTVLLTGIPRSGVWRSGDDVTMCVGNVTDDAHDGFFRIAGATTAAGETSPTLYQGGRVMLGDLTFG